MRRIVACVVVAAALVSAGCGSSIESPSLPLAFVLAPRPGTEVRSTT